MDHAVEGMRKVTKEHPHAIMAASGLERFLKVLQKWPPAMATREALDKALVTPDDLLQLQLAAWQCYFSPASVIYGLSHRIGHILGGTFGLPHSATSCITLAPVIRACADFTATSSRSSVHARRRRMPPRSWPTGSRAWSARSACRTASAPSTSTRQSCRRWPGC